MTRLVDVICAGPGSGGPLMQIKPVCPSVGPRVNLARMNWKMRSVSARPTPAAQPANSREVAAGAAAPPFVLGEAAADGRPEGLPRPERCREAPRADILACPAVQEPFVCDGAIFDLTTERTELQRP